MDQLKQIAQTMASASVVLALVYIIHELIQALLALDVNETPGCISNEQPDTSLDNDREGADTLWRPDRVIRSTGTLAYAPGAGD